MVFRKKCLGAVAALILSFVILAAAVLLVSAQGWTYPFFSADKSNVRQLSAEEMTENYRRLIRYILCPQEQELELVKLPLSGAGSFHFLEVRQIFLRMEKALLTLLLPLSALALILLRRYRDASFLRLAANLSLSIPLFLSLPLLLSFDRSFVLFHRLFFDNDAWLFDPAQDPIILYLPASLFLKNAVFILVVILLISIGLRLLARRLQPRLAQTVSTSSRRMH